MPMLRSCKARDLFSAFRDLKYFSGLLSFGGITISPRIFKLISGKLLVRFFDNKNKVKKEFILDKKNFFLLINKNTIYDVKAISKYVFVNEFMEGPFEKKLFKTP